MGSNSIRIAVVVGLVLLAFHCPGSALYGQSWDGSGTEGYPFLIDTPEQLNEVGLWIIHWDKHFKLMADIDLSVYTGSQFNLIGDGGQPFTGVFDGNRHVICDFTYVAPNGEDPIGLFRSVTGVVKDLGLKTPFVESDGWAWNVGALAGGCFGTVSGCYVEGGVVQTRKTEYGPTASHCVGGLAGTVWGTLVNCYSSCSVKGGSYVGGLAGEHTEALVTHCYSVGPVTGGLPEYTGGLLGGEFVPQYPSTIIASFWDKQASHQGGSDGGIGKTTEQMQTPITFLGAGWDFGTPIWTMCAGSYPVLAWQRSRADFVCEYGVDEADFVFLAEHWLNDNCQTSDWCGGTDLDYNQEVSIGDFAVFAQSWLTGQNE